MQSEKTIHSWLDHPLSSFIPKLNAETVLIAIILVLAVISRFYNVGLRVMSHDEVNHVVPSYDLYRGKVYQHDPVTHGPFQFHVVALSYFLFGDNDTTSRLPANLFSIATVAAAMLCFRRYLGRSGALIAGVLFLISPYLLFYGRYTRNEAFVALFGVLTLYGILRYLERGDRKSLYLLTVVTAMQFITKETSFIYTATFLLFTGFHFLVDVSREKWQDASLRNRFTLLVLTGMILIIIGGAFAAWNASILKGLPAPQAVEGSETLATPAPWTMQKTGMIVMIALGGLAAAASIYTLLSGLGWHVVRNLRSFDLMALIGLLILPQLTAISVGLLGWDPLDYSTQGMLRTGSLLVLFFLISGGVGWLWKRSFYITCMALFYGIFTVFYTTFFTNGRGFFTGIIGSLGYWLSQQEVQRGSQPWYYYAFIQIPIYEYLALLGTLLALYFGIRYWRFATLPGVSPAHQELPESVLPIYAGMRESRFAVMNDSESTQPADQGTAGVSNEPGIPENLHRPIPVLAMLLFWSVISLVAYSIAGEKMPWLTVHIAVPMLLAAGWGLGFLVDSIPWQRIATIKTLLAVLLLVILLSALAGALGSLLGPTPPFNGNTQEALESSSQFLLSTLAMVLSAYGLSRILRDWETVNIIRLVGVIVFSFLGILTARVAITSSYIRYDEATEFLVYAHAARGPKDILEQVEEISQRTTLGKGIAVAYDNDSLYPYWWYFRDYPNKFWYTDKPTRELREKPIILAGDGNFGKLDPITRGNFIHYDYMRLWWPMQDYFGLTWERVWNTIRDPKMRSAVFQIWFNRDYSSYAQLTGNPSLTLETWQPSNKIRMYIRKDIVAQIWNYGTVPATSQEIEIDPYEKKMIRLDAEKVIGFNGSEAGQFQGPRGVAVASDGSLYVADTKNHRVQHISEDGQVLQMWGSYADLASGSAPGGTFNEPWGIAVGPDGSVYVTDTWNHRVQRFSAEGRFIAMWGYFGQAEAPEAFWGPRGIAVDRQGRVYVADTGNKRIVVFDQNGNYLTQFGSAGMDLGQFDEPVGLAVDADGILYVADTWNLRVQALAPDESVSVFIPVRSWDIDGWAGQSLDNKPFIAVDAAGQIYVTDPESYRVLVFDSEGNFVRGWGDASEGLDGFGLAGAVAVGDDGSVWVTDAGYGRLMRFRLP